MKILITGGAGFIGSKLSTFLLDKGFEVTILDNLMFSKNSLNHLFVNKKFKFFEGDVRKSNFIKKHIKNKDFVIPLAGLVGAPLCAKHPKLTIETNLNAVKTVLKYMKPSQKIIYPTSNSGYGIGEKNKFCDENSPLNPISLYGRTKADAEIEVLKNKNSVCFRLATLFGYSYRMRSDLLVNNLVFNALKDKKLSVFQPHFRRNFIHIDDVVRAFYFAIMNFTKLKGEIYNLGLSSANITKIALVNKIKKNIPGLKIKIIKNRKDPDQRDYFVSNKKIEKKGFKANISLDDGIKELIQIFQITDLKIKNNY
jgi:nucleoside-diphosphate-sugar epimerase